MKGTELLQKYISGQIQTDRIRLYSDRKKQIWIAGKNDTENFKKQRKDLTERMKFNPKVINLVGSYESGPTRYERNKSGYEGQVDMKETSPGEQETIRITGVASPFSNASHQLMISRGRTFIDF